MTGSPTNCGVSRGVLVDSAVDCVAFCDVINVGEVVESTVASADVDTASSVGIAVQTGDISGAGVEIEGVGGLFVTSPRDAAGSGWEPLQAARRRTRGRRKIRRIYTI